MRSATGKMILGGTAVLLVLLVLIVSALFFLYQNPSRVKDPLVRTLSGLSGLALQVEVLEWEAAPLRLRMEGIQASSRQDPAGSLKSSIRALDVAMRLEGDFGKRTLVIESAQVRELDLALEGAPDLPGTGIPKPGDPSWAARAGMGLANLLLFQDIRIEYAELEKGRVTVKTRAANLSLDRLQAAATEEGIIHASLEARMEYPALNLVLDLPRIDAEADLQDGTRAVRGRLSIEDGILEHPDGAVHGFSLHFLADGDLDDRRIEMDSFDLHLPDIRPFLHSPLQSPLEAFVSASGAALTREKLLEIGKARVTLRSPPAEFEIETGIRLSWDPILKGSLEVLSCRFLPADWIPLLPAGFAESLQGIEFSGPLSVSGGVEASLDDRGLHFLPDLSLSLEENLISVPSPPLKASGRISGELKVFGGWPDLMVSADIQTGGLEFEHPSFRTLPSEALVRLSGTPGEIHLQEADLKVPEIHMASAGSHFAMEDVRLRADKGLFKPFTRALEMPEVRIEADGFGPAFIEVRFLDGKAALSTKGHETGILSFVSRHGRPFETWNLKGKDSFQISAETDDSGTWRFSGRLEFADLSFENREIDSFAEGLGLTLSANGAFEKEAPVFLDSLSLRVSSGEVLSGRFYLDMEAHPLSLKARTGIAFEPFRLLDSQLDVGIEDLVSASMSGSLEQAGNEVLGTLAVAIPWFRLEPAFRVFAVEPYGIVKPVLRSVSLEGDASADLHVKSDSTGHFISGEARLREASLSLDGSPPVLEDATLSLPVIYGTIPNDSYSLPLTGKLEVETLRIPFLPEQSLALDLEALPNLIRIPDDMQIMIPGGFIRLSPVTIAHDKREGVTLESAAHFEEVDLRPLLEAFWAEAPGGRLSGSLDPLVFRDGAVTALGALEAEVFEGRVRIENIGASGLFGSASVFGLDARWEDLHLEQMTEGTEFGRITGILNGYIEGFELAYGQPQRFFLLAETVQTRGVEQRISVRAVDNIAQIGGGGSPFVGMAGYFTSLFREFPYERIGVRAILEADVFRINGTILEGDREYIIKRSGFSGVNVVNQNPDNRIGFKDMVKRIQRVTTSHGGPVIQ